MPNTEEMRRLPPPAHMHRDLGKWQIFMITISATVGLGFVIRSGEILAFGGPATVLLSFAVVGIVVVAVMEGISEMVITWPIPNPLVEYVRRFVDRDLAVVVGVAYWSTSAISFPALISAAGGVVKYWDQGQVAETLVYVSCPLLVFFINFNTVKLFGYIELFGGVLKLLITFIVLVIMLCLSGGVSWSHPRGEHNFIGDGFTYRCQVAKSSGISILIGMNLAVFPFIGVESVAMTAFEAKNTRELKPPAKNISFIVLSVYMVSIITLLLNVSWEDIQLMVYYDQWEPGAPTSCPDPNSVKKATIVSRADAGVGKGITVLLPVIASDNFHVPHLGGAINACLLYSGFSTANSALFVASRTLYGLGSSIQRDTESRVLRWLSKLGEVDHNGVPQRAIIGSMVFAWVPFLSLGNTSGTDNMQDILQSVGTTSCIVVWASQAVAFLRYHRWLRRNHLKLKGDYRRFDRFLRTDRLSWLEAAQPWLAWFALIGTLTILLIFASAGMWTSEPKAQEKLAVKALDQYLGPGLMLLIFIGLKVVKRRWWVHLGDWEQLRETLNDLNDLVMATGASTGNVQPNASLEHNSAPDDIELPERVNGVYEAR